MRSIQALSLAAGESASVGTGAEGVRFGIDGFSGGLFSVREFKKCTRRRLYHIIILACGKITSLRNESARPGRTLDPHITRFRLRCERLTGQFLATRRRLGVDFMARQHTDEFLSRVFPATARLLLSPLNNVSAFLVFACCIFDNLITLSA